MSQYNESRTPRVKASDDEPEETMEEPEQLDTAEAVGDPPPRKRKTFAAQLPKQIRPTKTSRS